MNNAKNIIETLTNLAIKKPNEVVFRYIEDENKEPLTLTYQEVHNEAKKIATNLLYTSKKGDRAIIH